MKLLVVFFILSSWSCIFFSEICAYSCDGIPKRYWCLSDVGARFCRVLDDCKRNKTRDLTSERQSTYVSHGSTSSKSSTWKVIKRARPQNGDSIMNTTNVNVNTPIISDKITAPINQNPVKPADRMTKLRDHFNNLRAREQEILNEMAELHPTLPGIHNENAKPSEGNGHLIHIPLGTQLKFEKTDVDVDIGTPAAQPCVVTDAAESRGSPGSCKNYIPPKSPTENLDVIHEQHPEVDKVSRIDLILRN